MQFGAAVPIYLIGQKSLQKPGEVGEIFLYAMSLLKV